MQVNKINQALFYIMPFTLSWSHAGSKISTTQSNQYISCVCLPFTFFSSVRKLSYSSLTWPSQMHKLNKIFVFFLVSPASMVDKKWRQSTMLSQDWSMVEPGTPTEKHQPNSSMNVRMKTPGSIHFLKAVVISQTIHWYKDNTNLPVPEAFCPVVGGHQRRTLSSCTMTQTLQSAAHQTCPTDNTLFMYSIIEVHQTYTTHNTLHVHCHMSSSNLHNTLFVHSVIQVYQTYITLSLCTVLCKFNTLTWGTTLHIFRLACTCWDLCNKLTF